MTEINLVSETLHISDMPETMDSVQHSIHRMSGVLISNVLAFLLDNLYLTFGSN
jgi:hypothetical protein